MHKKFLGLFFGVFTLILSTVILAGQGFVNQTNADDSMNPASYPVQQAPINGNLIISKNVINFDHADIYDETIFDLNVTSLDGSLGFRGQVSDAENNSLKASFELLPGIYKISEVLDTQFDRLSCADGDNSLFVEVRSSETTNVTCTNQKKPAYLGSPSFSLEEGNSRVIVRWMNIWGAEGYKLYYSTNKSALSTTQPIVIEGCPDLGGNVINSCGYIISGLQNGVEVYVDLKSTAGSQESEFEALGMGRGATPFDFVIDDSAQLSSDYGLFTPVNYRDFSTERGGATFKDDAVYHSVGEDRHDSYDNGSTGPRGTWQTYQNLNGYYDVYTTFQTYSSNSNSVKYTVGNGIYTPTPATGSTLEIFINQQLTNSGTVGAEHMNSGWIYLGTFRFNDIPGVVSVATNTFYGSYIQMDAIAFQKSTRVTLEEPITTPEVVEPPVTTPQVVPNTTQQTTTQQVSTQTTNQGQIFIQSATTSNQEPVEPSTNEISENLESSNVLGASQTCEVSSTVSGYVFLDLSSNNIKEESERGITGVELSISFEEIVDGVGKFTNLRSVRTNTLGKWETRLCAGNYKIQVNSSNLPNNSRLGGEDFMTFNISEGEDKNDVNFAIYDSNTPQSGLNWLICLVPVVIILLLAGAASVLSASSRSKNEPA
jgi:hypothetical protein